MLETMDVHIVIERLLKEKKGYNDFVKAFYCFFFYASFLSIYNFS